MKDGECLRMWTVWPRPTASVLVCDDLARLRDMLAFELHLVCLTRNPEDDGKIVETWL